MKNKWIHQLAATILVTSSLAFTAFPAYSLASFDDLLEENGGDIPREHWAVDAIRNLVDKYGIMAGYPSGVFKGNKDITRYEMAAAVYHVMKEFERKLSQIPIIENQVTKEDLRTLAALQLEYKKELEQLRKRHHELEKRVDWLEKVQTHGEIELRYRDRLQSTDGGQTNSPLFSNSNFVSNTTKAIDSNLGDFKRDDNAVPQKFHSPAQPLVTHDDLMPFRAKGTLRIEAQPSELIKGEATFSIYDQQVDNGGHDNNEGNAQFWPERIQLEVGNIDAKKNWGVKFRAGYTNFSGMINPGTSFFNHFGNSQWNGHGYGLVGWGGSEKAVVNNAKGTDYKNSVSRYWMGGLNASNVDPDSLRHNQASGPAMALDASWGWGKVLVGLTHGASLTNRKLAAANNLSGLYAGDNTLTGLGSTIGGTNNNFQLSANQFSIYPSATLASFDRRTLKTTGTQRLVSNLLPLPSENGDGYGVVGLEFNVLKDWFPIRFGAYGMSFFKDAIFDFTSQTRKEISGVLDLGWNDGFGMTIQANKSFIGYDKHSLGVFFNNLGNSGFDIQLGLNLATRGLFNLNDIATGSVGFVFGVPFIKSKEDNSDNLELLLGVRQSLGDGLGSPTDVNGNTLTGFQTFKDSGFTASLMYENIASTPLDMRLEYSILMAEELWAFRTVAHDMSLISTYRF